MSKYIIEILIDHAPNPMPVKAREQRWAHEADLRKKLDNLGEGNTVQLQLFHQIEVRDGKHFYHAEGFAYTLGDQTRLDLCRRIIRTVFLVLGRKVFIEVKTIKWNGNIDWNIYRQRQITPKEETDG